MTTVLGVLDKPALIPWSINQAIELIRPAIAPGVEHAESYLEEVYAQAKKEATRTKRMAADIGSQVHAALERYPDVGTPTDERVSRCVGGAVDWLQRNQVEYLQRECLVYSRRHRYSGRFDGLCRVNGTLALIDWKTSQGIYPEYRLQTAAYLKAYEEEHPSEVIQQRILIRLGKEDGAFEPHVYSRDSLRADFNAFLAALRIYTRMKQIEKEERLSRKKEKEGQIIDGQEKL